MANALKKEVTDPFEIELRALTINKLRLKARNDYALRVTPDLTQDDLVAAIIAKTQEPDTDFVFDTDTDHPGPGYDRIVIQRDPNPQATNSPIFMAINGSRLLIKRGREVDVAKKFVVGLHDSTTRMYVQVQNHSGASGQELYEVQDVLDYPYTVVERGPEGPDPQPGWEVSKMGRYKKQVAFRDKNGRWPRGKERDTL